jgi:biopolymer transport protein ExbD
MEFRRKRDKKSRIKAELNMTPLINCVLLLLVFFMLTNSFVARSSVNIEMPIAVGETQYDQTDVSITLAPGTDGPGGKGRIYLGNTETTTIEEFTDKLSAEVARLRAQDIEPTVLILPDASVSTGRLVEVLSITRSLGIQRYRIAALPPGGSG